MDELLVRAKGRKVLPSYRADEAFPKPGKISAPVIKRVSLAETRSVESWSLLTDRI